MPLISIIVPCYNQAQYLDECLQSVLEQTYTDWECIIINDGSPDNTEEIAKNWLEKDGRFKYYYKENGGVCKARNFGILKAKGEYINFLDADDIIKEQKLELQLKDLQTAEISICNYKRVDYNLIEIEKRYFTPFTANIFDYDELIINWENKISIPIHTVLFKRVNLHNKISFNENLINHEDWIFWLELFYYNKDKIAFNKEVMALYRFKEISVSTKKIEMKKGFLKACDIMYFFYKSENDKKCMDLIIKKKKLIENKKNLKTIIADTFPIVYKYYKKNVK